MSDAPPPYANYPRGFSAVAYGSADRLQSLSDGYYGLNIAFGINVLLAIGGQFVIGLMSRSLGMGALPLLIYFLLFAVAIGFLSFPYNKKIGFGKNWPRAYPILASVLMALNSALCCGAIGYVVMQQIASNEMVRYGIPKGFLGLKKANVLQRIAELRSIEAAAGSAMPPVTY